MLMAQISEFFTIIFFSEDHLKNVLYFLLRNREPQITGFHQISPYLPPYLLSSFLLFTKNLNWLFQVKSESKREKGKDNTTKSFLYCSGKVHVNVGQTLSKAGAPFSGYLAIQFQVLSLNSVMQMLHLMGSWFSNL